MFVSYDRDTTDLASKAVGYDRANEDKFLFFLIVIQGKEVGPKEMRSTFLSIFFFGFYCGRPNKGTTRDSQKVFKSKEPLLHASWVFALES